jgi:hypothetical protein
MVVSYMKKIIAVLLSCACYVHAVEIPLEENLSIINLDNGIQLWLKQHARQSGKVSCRIVAKSPLEEIPQIFPLADCSVDAFEDELPVLIDDCLASIENEAQWKIAVVIVGDFEKEKLKGSVAAAFEVFSQRELAPLPNLVSVIPSSQPNIVDVLLTYPTSFSELKTDQDLKKLWVLYLLQSIVEERFRKGIKQVDGQWVSAVLSNYLLPYTHTIARSRQQLNQEPVRMLKALLGAMQEFKGSGFSEQELSVAKAKLQKNLLSFYQQSPDSECLANYYASHFAFGAGCPSYPIFMAMSFQTISQIERKDLAELLGNYFKDDTRRVVVSAPRDANITEASIQLALDATKSDDLVVKLEGNAEGKTPFAQLPITEAEAQIIYQIIDTVGTNGLPSLFLKQGELKDLGNKVQHVHPLKFLEVVFTNPHLKECMKNVEEYPATKLQGFMQGSGGTPGFIQKCDRENGRNNLQPYVLGFCQAVKAHPDQVRDLVEKKQWEKLVRYLIKLEN